MKTVIAAHETAPRGAQSARARILTAARACLERDGIDRVTIVDIAEAANYSRPVVYKHFADKAEIVDELCLADMKAVGAALRDRIPRSAPYEERLVEAILQAVLLARGKVLLQRLLDDRESWLRSQTVGERVRDWVRERWEAFLRRGKATQLLAEDLDLDEVVEWIAMNQSQLLLRHRSDPIDEARVRHFVRRFIVRPLLP